MLPPSPQTGAERWPRPAMQTTVLPWPGIPPTSRPPPLGSVTHSSPCSQLGRPLECLNLARFSRHQHHTHLGLDFGRFWAPRPQAAKGLQSVSSRDPSTKLPGLSRSHRPQRRHRTGGPADSPGLCGCRAQAGQHGVWVRDPRRVRWVGSSDCPTCYVAQHHHGQGAGRCALSRCCRGTRPPRADTGVDVLVLHVGPAELRLLHVPACRQ